MFTKIKGPTTLPHSKPATILASRNLASFVDDYVTSTKAKQNIRKAIVRKNPSKSYGEIYSNLYDFSYYVTFLCHCISFLLALSFGAIFMKQFGQIVLGFAVPMVLSYGFAAVALGTMEWGQNTSLDILFNVKFLTGRLPSGILVLCLGLSAISIASSTYSMSYLFSDNQLFARIGVGISLINELGIISLSYWRHAYEFKAEQEANLLNDLTHNFDYNSLFHQSSGLSVINQNRVANSSAKIEVDKGAKHSRTNILVPSNIEIQKFGLFKEQAKPLRSSKTSRFSNEKDLVSNAAETPKTSVQTRKQGKTTNVWTLKDINTYITTYRGKIADGKTFAKVANFEYFKAVKKDWQTLAGDAGIMAKIPTAERYKWFEKNHPEKAARLKKADSKKRSK